MGRPFGNHEHHMGHGHGGPGGGHRRHGGRNRLFDYGEIRLLVLALIAEQPRHGYELIKAIEERLGGSYTPSPGVIYPTLAWLDDMGLVQAEAEGNRKSFSITPEGEAYLAEHRAAADALLARSAGEGRGRHGLPSQVIRAMENLKLAMRLRMRDRPVDDDAAAAIAAALDAAAQAVERS
jgi:DNA-binding PadR family transcriptional regulator